MNPFIYKEYTGVMSGVLQYLSSIQKLVAQEKITIKVPHIPGFNDEEDFDSDIDEIKQRYGFEKISKIKYRKL